MLAFGVIFLQALSEDDSESEAGYSPENAARAEHRSLFGVGIDALRTGARMLVFLVPPAIA